MKKIISIIIPIFNEEETLPILYRHIQSIIDQLNETYQCELILVNDGSKDRSWDLIHQHALEHQGVIGITFSRNFGHQAALKAGYDIATGDAIITMDADMQDPPSLLFSMIQRWNDGFDIVYARRIDRQDSFFKKWTAFWYYALLDKIAEVSMPRNVGDFRLIDKKVLAVVKQSKEQSPYFRGMVAWTGFKQSFVDFKRPDRVAGTSGYTWSKMFKLAFDGMTSFSLFPLRLAAFFGLFVMITGSLMFVYISIDALCFRAHYPLFKWLVTIVYICMGIQFMLLWIIGEYVGRIYNQDNNRPLYVIEKIIN
jgi:polyisoprenyl-phosphate glycosyltransferase